MESSLQTPAAGQNRILLVEDEAIVVRDIETALDRLGYEVVASVDSGEEAVAKARELRPDLVLMDVRLGGAMTGIQAAAEIRQARGTPVIYITAHSDEETLRRAKETGPFGFVVKPFKASELRCAIEVALHKHLYEEAIRTANAELERRVAERTAALEARKRDVETFACAMAHDLSTPLRTIEGYAYFCTQTYGSSLSEHALELLRGVRESAQLLGRKIDALLRYIRISEKPVRRDEVDLTGLAREAAALARGTHPGREVELRVEAGMRARGDGDLLRVVLENLLDNAWKFSGKVDAPRVEVGRIDTGGGEVFYVRDNGAGFDMSHAGPLFGAFSRLHRADEFEGAGMGLAIARRILALHGGDIRAESLPGRGATFYFRTATAAGPPVR